MAQGYDIEKNFKYHPPTGPSQTDRYVTIRNAARAFAESVMQESKPSREQSLSLTKIEEAMMWANAGIARNEE